MSRAPAIVALAAALAAGRSARAELSGSLTASVGPGFDSNPARTVGGDEQADGYLGLAATGKGRATFGEASQAQARYELGLRKFFRDSEEDMVVQQLELDVSTQVGRAQLGVEAAGKLRLSQSHARDYKDLSAGLYLDWVFTRELSARLDAGVRGFIYDDPSVVPAHAYDMVGPTAELSLRWQPLRRHVFTLAALGSLPYYRGKARYWDGDHADSDERRRDRVEGVQVAYAFRGPVTVQGGYTYLRGDSNSFGETNERHRLWAAVAARLPWRLWASAQLAWQYLRYPEGIFLTSQDLLLLDDESQSSAALKLAISATENVDVELRYAVYWIALPPAQDDGASQGTTWLRHTAFVAVTLRL